MPDITLAIGLLRKPIESAAAAATGQLQQSINKLKATANLKIIYQKLNSTQKVKTLWNVDRALALSTFYYPAKIKTSTGATQTIHELDDIPHNAVVLAGTVVQGKSILMRYLVGREMRSGQRLPLLVELRRVSSGGLMGYIHAEFKSLLSIDHEAQIFDLFAQQGKVSLLLDGYDEIDPEQLSDVTTVIESLVARYPQMRVVVSSRPESGIEKSALFDVIPIAKLEPSDLLSFFNKILSRDKASAKNLYDALMKSSIDVKSLTSTPLLATLLTVVYRANQTIPSDFVEFYDLLFQILLIRHDLSKPGYRRTRKTKLSDRQIQQVFEAYCFKSKAVGSASHTKQVAMDLAAKSIAAQGVECDESEFLSDIIKVTCLLQEEGGLIEYVHQSVMEFYAARYLASRPEEVAKAFYEKMFESTKRVAWDQVLSFLSQLDKYRSSRYFYIPALTIALAQLESGSEVAAGERLVALIAEKIMISQTQTKDGTWRYIVLPSPMAGYKMHSVYQRLYQFMFGGSGKVGMASQRGWDQCFDHTTPNQKVSYAAVARHCGFEDKLTAELQCIVAELAAELKRHMEAVNEFDASKDFMDI